MAAMTKEELELFLAQDKGLEEEKAKTLTEDYEGSFEVERASISPTKTYTFYLKTDEEKTFKIWAKVDAVILINTLRDHLINGTSFTGKVEFRGKFTNLFID